VVGRCRSQSGCRGGGGELPLASVEAAGGGGGRQAVGGEQVLRPWSRRR